MFGTLNCTYQSYLRAAIAFIAMAEVAIAPDIKLVLLASFTHRDYVTINFSTRHTSLSHIVAERCGRTCRHLQ
jgi:uncharacterized membrane protein